MRVQTRDQEHRWGGAPAAMTVVTSVIASPYMEWPLCHKRSLSFRPVGASPAQICLDSPSIASVRSVEHTPDYSPSDLGRQCSVTQREMHRISADASLQFLGIQIPHCDLLSYQHLCGTHLSWIPVNSFAVPSHLDSGIVRLALTEGNSVTQPFDAVR